MRGRAGPLVFVVLIGSGCAGTTPVSPPRFRVEARVDPQSQPVPNPLANQIWGLRPIDQLPPIEAVAKAAGLPVPGREAQGTGQGKGKAPQGKQGLSAEEMASIRSRFGSNVLISADGRVTKEYFLSGETGTVFLNLLAEPGGKKPEPNKVLGLGGGAKSQSILSRMIGDHPVELIYLDAFETVEGMAIKSPVTGVQPGKMTGGVANNLLLVTAKPEGLEAFEGALNLFFANIPQVEIQVKVVEFRTTDTLNFGISQIDKDTPTFNNIRPGRLIKNITSAFPLTPPLVGGSNISDKGIITLGGIQDSFQLNAQLELLEANSVADILSSPTMVVRNGGVASVSTTTAIPFPKAKITANVNVESNIDFKDVGITLNIRPVIAGTETVILQIYAKVSAVTGFVSTQPVRTPIISTREVITSVHVPAGKTTVIGGLVTKSTFDQVQKIPILGDIPILGYLFRSTSTETSETTLEFHITPRIIQGSQGFPGEPIGG